jgi:type IV secretion system protein VirB10
MSENDNNLPPEDQNNPPPVTGEGDGGEQPQNFSFDEAALEDPDETALNRRGSSLGGGSGKAITFGTALLLGTGIILYYLFSDTPPPPKPNTGGIVPTKPSGEIISQPSSAPPASMSIAAPAIPTAPPAPPPPPPPPPPPAPPAVVKQPNAAPPKPAAPLAPPEIRAIGAPDDGGIKLLDKRAANRMRSNMLLINGGATAGGDDKKAAKAAINQNDPNAAFASNVIESSQAESVTATRMSNMNQTIAQGKIVNAVLETAINTDLPGTLRAIISRDVYAEAGRSVLIPKGSRLIGTYNTGIFRGQKRVLIVWTRVITPEGIDMAIGSPGIDSLGRAGVQGQVDNKFMESFSAAILTSMITLGVGIAADNSISGNNSSTTNTDGSSTTTGSAGAAAITGAVRSVGDVSSSIVNSLVDLRPTITIDQGTRINVFVNKDVLVPGQTTSGSMFVQ